MRPLLAFLLLGLLLCSAIPTSSSSSASSFLHSYVRPRALAQKRSGWQTVQGAAPLVIARGGSSGLFPDQTEVAYFYAVNNCLNRTALFCDLQLTKDSVGICRTGIDLGPSTSITQTYPNLVNQYDVNGQLVTGFFSIDLTAAQVANLTAIQAIQSRPPNYDGVYYIFPPENVSLLAAQSPFNNTFWLNVEYPSFFAEHKLDMASYVLSSLKTMMINYISSPEIKFLKAIRAGAPKTSTKLILEFQEKEAVDPSTNATYGSLLNNLAEVATFAAGILVPKVYIWPVDNATSYLESQTTLLQDAHDAGLAVYVTDIASDAATPIYNYSFDPIREYLQYIPTTGPVVDGFLTDFPSTASEALACYRSSPPLKQIAAKTNPLIISHNGASGDYPGCTLLAYQGAVEWGASYIDCPIQMTKDGVPICRESPNLLISTDVGSHSNFFPSRLTSVPDLQSAKGIFTFNMTWEEIDTLKATIYSPEQQQYKVVRNPAYIQENIMRLSDFLDFAKNISAAIGLLLDIQNGYFLDTQIHLDVVGAVLTTIKAAGLEKSDRFLVQSEDSAILERVQQLTSFGLVYRVPSADVEITKTEVQKIKALAPSVTLPRALIETDNSGFLVNPSNVVDLFHAQNVTVFVSYLRNEFVAIDFDFEADPTLELNTLVQYFKLDGLITDFPATASAYLSNLCLNTKTEPAGFAYPLHLVVPDVLVNETQPFLSPSPPPPSNGLQVAEPALPPTVESPAVSPSSTSLSPVGAHTPTPQPSAASSWAIPCLLVATSVIATAFHNLVQ